MHKLRLILGLILILSATGAHAQQISSPGGSSSGGGSTSTALSALTSATATNSIDSTLFAQTFNWSTLSTQTAWLLAAPAMTTGTILDLSGTGTGTSYALQATLTGANTGYAGYFSNPSATGYGVYVSGAETVTGAFVLTGTAKGVPFPEIYLRATTTDTTGDITPGDYTPTAGSNGAIGIPGYTLLGAVTSGTATLTLTGFLPPIIPQGTLYLRQRYLTPVASTSGTIKATVSDVVVTNSGNPFTSSLTAETQTAVAATTTDTFTTVDTALTSTATANGVAVVNYQLNATTSPSNDWVGLSLVIK